MAATSLQELLTEAVQALERLITIAQATGDSEIYLRERVDTLVKQVPEMERVLNVLHEQVEEFATKEELLGALQVQLLPLQERLEKIEKMLSEIHKGVGPW